MSNLLLSAKTYAFNSNQRNREEHKKTYMLYDWFSSLVTGTFIVFFIFTFLIASVVVIGDSMVPSFSDGDHLLISSLFYNLKKGDVVVVAQQQEEMKGEMAPPLIKRVIATEGDLVDIDFSAGIVYVNDIPLVETYISEPILKPGNEPMTFPLTVSENTIFVLGDNRNASRDSRDTSVGLIDLRYVYGKVLARYFPSGDFFILKNPHDDEEKTLKQ